jgi:hypothetical protein
MRVAQHFSADQIVLVLVVLLEAVNRHSKLFAKSENSGSAIS